MNTRDKEIILATGTITHKHRANKWDLPTEGDKENNPIVSSAIEVGNTVKNPFTHTLSDQLIYVLLSTLSVLWAAGFEDEAKLLFEKQNEINFIKEHPTCETKLCW